MERAGDILKDAIIPPAGEAAARYLPLFRNWRSIVGKDMENRLVLRDIRKDALMVEVAHPGWMQTVLLRKKTILKRINDLYPGIGVKEIKVRIVKQPPPRVVLPGKQAARKSEDRAPAPDAREIDDLLSGMSENDLKKALKRLYVAHAKRKTP